MLKLVSVVRTFQAKGNITCSLQERMIAAGNFNPSPQQLHLTSGLVPRVKVFGVNNQSSVRYSDIQVCISSSLLMVTPPSGSLSTESRTVRIAYW